jgi:anti-sigma factor ChrR (cupin superfamily)
MKTMVGSVWVLVLSLAAAGLVLATATESTEKTSEVSPTALPAADLRWIELDPTGAPGVKVADLWGDHRTGSFGAIFRLPPGFSAPLHTHTHAMKLVVLSGTYIQGPEGKPEFRLGPSSYLMQPGGTYRHTTSCDPASECIFFVESNGAFDLHPATAESAAPPKEETSQLEPLRSFAREW